MKIQKRISPKARLSELKFLIKFQDIDSDIYPFMQCIIEMYEAYANPDMKQLLEAIDSFQLRR